MYNREPVPALKNWIDSEMKVMWGMQEESGIIDGAYPDGNFERTAIIYTLWKTQGVHCFPWREDLKIGAEMKDGKLFIALSADKEWRRKFVFDYQRHRKILHLPIDYPRINQFPEWFSVTSKNEYEFFDYNKKTKTHITGIELRNGVELNIGIGEKYFIVVNEIK